MTTIADLLRKALQEGDQHGRTRIRRRLLPDAVFAELVEQTHRHALEHATGDGEWLVFSDGIAPWWQEEADLTAEESRRLLPGLRTDVVKRLTDQELAYREPAKSPLLYVRRDLLGDNDMGWAKPGPGRPPRISDPEIAELRRRHVDRGIALITLSAQTGLSVDMLHRIMIGERRKRAGGPIMPKPGPGRKVSPRVTAAIRADLIRGQTHRAIARKHDVSVGYVAKIARELRQRKSS